MALPTAVIGSQSKSVFEEIGRRLRKKNRKVLWAIWYFLWSFPMVLIAWLSSLFTWVDVYGIPATKPCNIGLGLIKIKGGSDQIHFIFDINVGKSRIRH